MRAPLILAIASIFLTSCAAGGGLSRLGAALDSRPNAGPCPSAGALYDTSRVVRFEEPENFRYTNISYTGEIIGTRLFCRYHDDDPLVAEIEIDFAFGKGPAAPVKGNKQEYQYYVAVMRRNSRVLEKKVFTVQAEFNGKLVDTGTELVNRIVIPRVDDTISGVNFEVIVGFELTDSELDFNLGGQRFRLDADDRNTRT